MNYDKDNCRSTLVYNLYPEDLAEYFNSLREEIASLRNDIIKMKRDTLLTRQEVAEMLKCDLSTIHNWTKSGILKAYRIGNRVYYKLSEIEDAMIPLRRAPR